MNHEFLRILDTIREDAGVPLYITSDYREGDSGAHGEGLAVDVSDNLEGRDISSRFRYKVLASLFGNNISRIGDYDRHLHFDISESHDQEVCWRGTSD